MKPAKSDAEMFPGREVTVRLGIEKRRGYPERNVILDYRPASSHVVKLRASGVSDGKARR